MSNINDSGAGSLRQAILDANGNGSGVTDTISFSIGTGAVTIQPTSALPTITTPVVIDGTTQPGFASAPIVELDGSSAGASITGLDVTAGSSTIRGLVINRFTGNGIRLATAGNNLVAGNYIGTDTAGTSARANGQVGIAINNSSNNNTIGGLLTADRNLIAGNSSHGISIASSASGTLIRGNWIGLSGTGTLSLSNGGSGIVINGPSNTVGGTLTGARNVISGNTNFGVQISGAAAQNNLLQGNWIGLNATGSAAVPNTIDGVRLESSATNNLVGGTASGAGNVVSGNGARGLNFASANNVAEGNFIGTDPTGLTAIGNASQGIRIFATSNVRIGGSSTAARNLISGNGQNGIMLDGGSSNSVVLGNYIGTNVTGNAAIPNSASGVRVIGPGNTVGGLLAAERNLISGNNGEGVIFQTAAAQTSVAVGNWIGLNVSGTAALANTGSGVRISGSSGIRVGGSTTAERNVIAGNSFNGVTIDGGSSNSVVLGNYIGTNISGNAAIPNLAAGVRMTGPSNTVGGTLASERNVISGNAGNGVLIDTTTAVNNVVIGNWIGLTSDGLSALGNANEGVRITNASRARVGGSSPAERNVISGNSRSGVIIDTGASNSAVLGNYIGTNASGTASVANLAFGVRITGPQNTVGGLLAAESNLISGNQSAGVVLEQATATENVVMGNWIGLNAAGSAALPNRTQGVWINTLATNNTVGGTVSGAGNVISGNRFSGLLIDINATNNLVAGNLIGTNSTGTASVANLSAGVQINAPNNTVGGTLPGARNVVSGNSSSGITLQTLADNSVVLGNWVGLNAAGNAAMGNGAAGVSVYATGGNVLIGGNASGAGNVISGNFNGIYLGTAGPSITIQGNLIGTDPTGTSAIANKWNGIEVTATSLSQIGGNSSSARNLISGNFMHGIYTNTGATNNRIVGNYIGTDITGNTALANQSQGVSLTSPGNTVGGSLANEGNVISGNRQNGIFASNLADGTVIKGNRLGTNAAGSAAIPNAFNGIAVTATAGNVLIGGTELGAGNLISGNTNSGVFIGTAGPNIMVQGNLIGTDATGQAAIPNQVNGVRILSSSNAQIGGDSQNARNIISGNIGHGVSLDAGASNISVRGNYIGTDSNGASAVSNGAAGIRIQNSNGNTIGGTLSASGNLISGNLGAG